MISNYLGGWIIYKLFLTPSPTLPGKGRESRTQATAAASVVASSLLKGELEGVWYSGN